MREIVLKGGLFCLIGLVILQILALVARKVSPDGTSIYYQIDHDHVQYVISSASQIEAIVVGNSHGDDLLLSEMDQTGAQLSRAWGDLFEVDYYLDTLVPRLPNLETVYIPISYFTFGWDNASAPKLGSRRVHLYSILPSWRFLEGDLKNYITGKSEVYFPIQSILREDNWKGIIYSLLSGTDATVEVVLASSNCDYLQREILAGHSLERAMDQIEIGKEIEAKKPHVLDDSYAAAVEIIEYLQQRGVRVVFFTPPYYEAYTAAYQQSRPEAIQRMKDLMQRLQETYQVEYYDFSSDENFIHDYTLFKDSDHLNECGARMFSRQLIEMVESRETNP